MFRYTGRLPGSLPLALSFVWTLAGSVTYSGCQWLLIVLLAKLGTAAVVGEYAFALAIAYPVSLLANLQLRVVFINDVEGRYRFDEMLGVKYVLAFVAFFTLFLICIVSGCTPKTTVVAVLVCGALLIDSLSDSYYSILQKYDRMDRIARSQIIRSLLSLGAAAGILCVKPSAAYAAIGLLLGRLFTLLAYDSAPETFRIGHINSVGKIPAIVGFAARIRPRWNFKLQLQMVGIAVPLGIVTPLLAFNGNVPRYVIERYLGPHDVGIYSALNYIPQAASMIAIALGYVTFAKLSRFYAGGDVSSFRSLLAKSTGLCLALGVSVLVICLLFGPTILRILYRPEYAQYTELLTWLVVAGVVTCVASCQGCALTATSQFRVQIPLFVTVTLVSLSAAYILVPRIGLVGAAIASLASLMTQLAGTWLILRRTLSNRMYAVVGEPATAN